MGILHAYLGAINFYDWYGEGYTFELAWKSIGACIGCVVMVQLGIKSFSSYLLEEPETED